MGLDQSFARAASRRSLADWIAVGGTFERALEKLLGKAHVEVQIGRPPTKVVKKAIDQLSQLMRQSGLPGEIRESGGRRHQATICMPEAFNDKISFVLVSGVINGRSGAISLTRRRVLTASQHVLERLHQRLGTTDSLDVLREVFSCLTVAVAMDEAARMVGALHWPLVTANGLFVCVPTDGDEGTILVTWMRLDQLGKKWGRVADDLRAAGSGSNQLLEDREFCVEILRLHSWLLRPHAPGPDLSAKWWASRPIGEQDDAVSNFEELLSEQTVDSTVTLDREADSASGNGEVEEQGAPLGGEICGRPHIVKARERYMGIVVQLRGMGARIVALRNGFSGMLRLGDRTKDDIVNKSKPTLQLGERVAVEVIRTVGELYVGPNSIILQLPEVANANWSTVQAQHSIGSIVSGTIVWRGKKGTVIAVQDGATGWLPNSELSWLLVGPSVHDALVDRQQMQLRVVGYDHEYRRLALSLREVEGRPVDWSIVEAEHPIGAIVDGIVVFRTRVGFNIEVADGSNGWLPFDELSWLCSDESLRDSFVIGQSIRLRIVGYEPRRRQLTLSLRQIEEHPLDRLDQSTFVGTTHQGIVANVVDYGAFVSLQIGIDGLIHRSNFPEGWSPSKGERLRVRVMDMDAQRRRVGLTYVDGNA